MAKRSGRPSAAQTPAPKSDKIVGSNTNKKGSATSKGASKISLSDKTISALKTKLEDFKKKYPKKDNVTLSDLKAVYRRGSGAYSGSHRPNISRAGWSYARTNKFLEKAAGKKVKAAYVQDDDLLKYEDGGLNEVVIKLSNGNKLVLNKDRSLRDKENYYDIQDKDGKNIGVFHISDEGGYYQIVKIELKKERTGLGTEIYKSIIQKLDKPLHSDPSLTDSSKGLWEKLVSQGIAEKYTERVDVNTERTKKSLNRERYRTVQDDDLLKYEKGGLIAPNGNPSNLTQEQYELVRTPNFKAWFGDWENEPLRASKVVDENGEPKVVYHGTYVETEFNIFDFYKADLGFHFGTYQQAKNRSETKKGKEGYKSIVLPYFLNSRILFEINDAGEFEYPQSYLEDLLENNIISGVEFEDNNFENLHYKEDNKIIRDFLIEKFKTKIGFIYNNKVEADGESYIVLQPNQIKLADNTNTTFDRSNPDVRYKDGGIIDFNKKMRNEYIPTWKEEYVTTEMINEMVARNYLYAISQKYYEGVNEIEFANESKNPKNHFQLRMYLGNIILWTAPFIYVDDNHNVVLKRTKVEVLNNDYETIKSNVKLKEGGELGEDITCSNCGWEWNTANSEGKDKYICHKCGQINNMEKYNSKDFKKGLKEELSEHKKTFQDLRNDKITVNEAAKKVVAEHLKEKPDYYEKYKGGAYLKKGGQLNPDDKSTKDFYAHKSGNAGGMLVGKRHSEGGIKAVNKSTGQPLEMEGGETVITRNAVSDNTKREFEGEMLTNRQILSKINVSGGGVSFAEGGDVPYKCACSGKKYKYGGDLIPDYHIVDMLGGQHEYFDSLLPSEAFNLMFDFTPKFEDGGTIYEEGGMIRLVSKKVPSLQEYISKNFGISKGLEKKTYKNYLFSTYSIVFDNLPTMVKNGLLMGNQKLVDKYING